MGFLFLAGAALLGVCVISRVAGRFLDGIEKALWGLVAGWSVATLLAYVSLAFIESIEYKEKASARVRVKKDQAK